MITRDQLAKISPQALLRADEVLPALATVAQRCEINTPKRIAAFLSQVLHESNSFNFMAESLNYSSAALLTTFNTSKVVRFTPAMADMYGRTAAHVANQQMIANIAYANRMGNGPVESGDGWRYRGQGPLQITGRANYEKCGAYLGLDLLASPQRLQQIDIGTLAAGWFWAEGNSTGKSLNALADIGQLDNISDIVNMGHATKAVGDSNGWSDRSAIYARVLAATGG